MRTRLSVILVLLALLPTGYLLWRQWQAVDLEIGKKFQLAEDERHGFVVSHDFDELKAKLIEVHRDHWSKEVKRESQARIATICLLVIVFALLGLLLRQLPRRGSAAVRNLDET